AARHAEADRIRKEKVEARYQLDSLIYQVEKALGERGNRVPADAKSRVARALERAKSALKRDALAEVNCARDELMQACAGAGQQIYQAQAAASAAAGATESPEGTGASSEQQSTSAGGEEVVDADYEIVEEDKR